MIRLLRGRPASPSVFRRSSSRRARSSSGRGSQRVCGGGPPTSCCVFVVVVSLQFPGDPSAWTDHVRVNERLRSLRPERALSSSRGMKLLSRTHSPSQGAWRLQTRRKNILSLCRFGGPTRLFCPREKARNPCTDDTASRGGRGGTVCNARVLAFCARRELARGLCVCGFVFGFWSPFP